ncbi:helix-turn-helix domain-containing protein [Odoribacter laneus]|uniref:helix-turn-helix domain-containing protein n=1 Tax=Odoribacter laneus TaxID=626933 RepID=UPI003AB15B9E
MEMITKESAGVTAFLKALDRIISKVEQLTQNSHPTLNGERFLTDREVSERLKVSRRALQDYRNQGKIPYYHVEGKILYKESDLEIVLKKAYYRVGE